MSEPVSHSFTAILEKIGSNPFVYVPVDILHAIFTKAGKNKGPIPVKGTVNERDFTQTLVKYSGHWRLYINTAMLKNSPKRIGEELVITIDYDDRPRNIEAPESFLVALAGQPEASAAYNALSSSRQMEINRYLARLKNPHILEANIEKAINFLLKKDRFAGRENP